MMYGGRRGSCASSTSAWRSGETRILALSWGISDHLGGGEPIAASELVRHLALAGASIDVVTPWIDVRRPFPDGVRVHRVTGGSRMGNSGANKWAMARKARELHRAGRYDATHVISQFTAFPIEHRPFVISGCWTLPALPDARRARRRAVVLTGAAIADVAADLVYALYEERLRGWTAARTVREADLVIVRQRLGLEPLARAARRVAHVPFGVDVETFSVSPSSREPNVLFAGRLERYKNVDALIRAFATVLAAVPGARLRIAGEGGERARLATLASELGVASSVDFLGYRAPRDLVAEYGRARVLCLPSRGESFGLVCLEAMACGVPVVVSDRISGAWDYVEDGVNGLRAPPGDATRLAECLGALIGDPALSRAMGERARATAERFAWADVARRHLELYRALE